jgi:hypothetical protein
MPYLKSLDPDAGLLDVFRTYPGVARPLLEFHEAVLRGPSPFTVAERELLADWDERALHDAVLVCGIFNLMNRMVLGLGVEATPEHHRISADRLHEIGYSGLAAMVDE